MALQHVAIGCASSGDNTLISATAGKRIRVLSCVLIAAGAVTVYFKDGTTGNDLIGASGNPMSLSANGGFVVPYCPVGWCETAPGESLVATLGGAVSVAGALAYEVV